MNNYNKELRAYCLARDDYRCAVLEKAYMANELVLAPFYDERYLGVKYDPRNYLVMHFGKAHIFDNGKFNRILHTKLMIKHFGQKEFVLFVAQANHYTTKIDCYVTRLKIERDIAMLIGDGVLSS